MATTTEVTKRKGNGRYLEKALFDRSRKTAVRTGTITAPKCMRCRDCGQIASGEEGAPWITWLEMPLHSAAAVVMGLVRPIPCPDCAGSKEQK